MAASQETVLVYTGSHTDQEDVERFVKFDSTVKRALAPNALKYGHLNEVKLKSTNANLSKSCKALLLAPENSREFDEECRRILSTYFRHGGKMIFFGDSSTDTDWMWFLKSISSGSTDFYESTKSVFEKFIKGERIPTNLQANAATNEFACSVAFFRIERKIPVLYLSSESGSTVAFVHASPEWILEQNVSVWKDLLRIVDVVVAAGQDHRFTVGRVLSRVEDHSVHNKPPNLFVYNGHQEDTSEFEKFSVIFQQALSKDTYVVYPLSHACIVSSLPWIPYCQTLFVSTEKSSQIDANVRQLLETYFKGGGKLMFFCDLESDPDCLWLLKSCCIRDETALTKIRDAFKRFDTTGLMPTSLIGKQSADDVEYYLAMMRMENVASMLYIGLGSGSVAVFAAGDPKKLLSQNVEVWKDMLRILDLDASSNVQPPFTSGYLLCKDQETRSKIYTALKSNAESTPDILFLKIASPGQDSPTFPLRVKEHHKDFDNDLYFKTLKTSKLGQAVVFIPVSRSVLATALGVHNASPDSDVVVVGHQQPTGQNFVKRQWISPPGSALFSFVINVAKDTPLGHNSNFVTCLTALAVVNAIKHTETYKQIAKIGSFPISFKWPNDVYHGCDTKIGGLVAKITKSETGFTIVVGIGINVSNQRPTACLNDFVPSGFEHFRVESVVSAVLNEFESLLIQLQKNGFTDVLKSVEQILLNNNQEVTLYKTKEKGAVVGLDENGYLKVKLNKSNNIIHVTFDPDIPLRMNCFDCLIKTS